MKSGYFFTNAYNVCELWRFGEVCIATQERWGEGLEGGEGGYGKSLGMKNSGLHIGNGRGGARKVGVHTCSVCSQRRGRYETRVKRVGVSCILCVVMWEGDIWAWEGVWGVWDGCRVGDLHKAACYLKQFSSVRRRRVCRG